MNFPKSQKTGRQAELAVEDAFLDWSWNVGHDQIDVGYDLCITPDHTVYHGIHFLAQVKGTSVEPRGSRLTAQVSKSRLRQYANNVLPVFILRVTPNRSIYWVHAQEWAKSNREKLIGDGKGVVTFDSSKVLNDREGFERYLWDIVGPLLQTRDPLSVGQQPSIDLANRNARRASPSSGESETQKVPELSKALSQLKLSFTPVGTAENIALVRDAHLYGLPRTFDVKDFNLAPIPGFEGQMKPLLAHGKLTMRSNASAQGHVLVCPGQEYYVLAQEVSLAAELFNGTAGVGITNESLPSPLTIIIRCTVVETSLKAEINLSIRGSAIYGVPLKEVDTLALLATWADQIAAEDAMMLTLDFNGIRQPLTPAVSPIGQMLPVFQRIRSLSRLHMISRTLNSLFTLEDSDVFSEEDFQDIDFGFDLLRGVQRSVTLNTMEVDSVGPEARKFITVPGEFLIQTHWQLDVAGKTLGHFPVEIHMTGYAFESTADPKTLRIVKGSNGQAWVSYKKHDAAGDHIVRRKT
ncbi:DUF4365 domain-containing protein [Stenotrophomonas indicatrix]|uniref:DUF4365 domain-containing protein n=1 Tax=Stenotrophomonas indicatrix TaxID=2045451 RepID=UPI003441F2DB